MDKSNQNNIRVLGKGLTAQAVKQRFPEASLYDDEDFERLYDKQSDAPTVVSPGIPPFNEMIQQSNHIMSDYDLFSDTMPFSIWISGTNGKTTTTQMIQHLLKSRGSVCGGNIGTPVCSLDEKKNIWILETSSFTLHYTQKAKPNLYILLPISEDHISWHGSYEAYVQAKLKPLDSMVEGEIAIIPQKFKDYPTQAMKITYSCSDDLCEEFGMTKENINFKEPFLLDALLALSCQKILFDEFDYAHMNKFVVDEHKIEEFMDKKGRLWVNDSKATNVDATLNALVSYKEKEIFLILGGDDKGVDLMPLFKNLKEYTVEIYTIGSNYQRLNELCEEYSLNFVSCKVLENAVNKISLKHHKDGVAMLSPAAASLDQYSSYKERGEKFKLFVSDLSLN